MDLDDEARPGLDELPGPLRQVGAGGARRPAGEKASRDVGRAGRARAPVAAIPGTGVACVPRVDRGRVPRLGDEDDHVVHLAPLTGNDVEAGHVPRPVRPRYDEAPVVVPPRAATRRVSRELESDIGAGQPAVRRRQGAPGDAGSPLGAPAVAQRTIVEICDLLRDGFHK